MNHKIEDVYNCLEKVAVKAPFESPTSEDICQSSLKIYDSYATLSQVEKDKIKELFTDFELRSFQARVGELCECAVNSSNIDYLFSALVLFDVGCNRREIMREEFHLIAMINYSINNYFDNKLSHDEVRSLVPCFYKKFKVFLERDDELNSLDVFNLKLSKDKNGKFIFKLIDDSYSVSTKNHQRHF